jgi:hypothetical protein
VPRLLSDRQKHHRLEVSLELKEQLRNDRDLMYSIVTGDENWIYWYGPETKRLLSQWKYSFLLQLKKVWQVKRKVKSTVICFFLHWRNCP